MQDIAGMTQETCPPEVQAWGIPCSCPFDLPIQPMVGPVPIEVSDLSTSVVSFLASGDFDVTVTMNTSANQHVACLRLKFTVQKA